MKTLLPVSLAICTLFTGCLPPPLPYRPVAPGYYYHRRPYPREGFGPAYLPAPRGPEFAPGVVIRPLHPQAYAPGRVVPGARPFNPALRPQNRGVRPPAPGVRQPVPAAGKPNPRPHKPLPGERPPPV